MSGKLSPLSDVSTIRGRPALEGPRRGPSRAGRRLTGKGKTNPRADLFETMKKISEERKEAILAKLSGPDRKPVAVVAAEEGVSTATLYNWRKQARREGRLLPDHDNSPEGWSASTCYEALSPEVWITTESTENTEVENRPRSATESCFQINSLCPLCPLW